MSKLIYLEPDEEITDVIDKISKADSNAVSLVIPRGSTLANSIVNLKLLSKRSKKLNKNVFLVTNDKIAHNLASQIGLNVFSTINEAKSGMTELPKESGEANSHISADKDEEVEEVDGIKVHKYDRNEDVVEGKPLDQENNQPVIDSSRENEILGETEVIEAVRDIDDFVEDSNLEVEKKEMVKKEVNPDSFRLEKVKTKNATIDPGHGRGFSSPFSDLKDRKFNRRKKIIVAASVLVFVLILASYVFIPTAKIVIAVVSEPFSAEANINISRDVDKIDEDRLTIPGKFIEKEQDLEKIFPSTGEKNVGVKSKGKITVYNNWDQQPINLPAGTTFSSGGIGFVSTSAVNVPGAQVGLQGGQFVIVASGTADVAVEAVEVGEQGNIGPSEFIITSIPKIQQSKIYGKSSSSMNGGTNQMVKIVSKQDIASAKTAVENELKAKITADLKSEIGEDYKLLDSALLFETISEKVDRNDGDQADTFQYLIKIKSKALSFLEQDFRQMLVKNAQSKLPDDQEIVSDKVEDINYQVISSDLENGKLELQGKFDGYVANKYDKNVIKSDIKGKSISKAVGEITSYDKVLSVDIITSPPFIHSIPYIVRNITIEYNYGQK